MKIKRIRGYHEITGDLGWYNIYNEVYINKELIGIVIEGENGWCIIKNNKLIECNTKTRKVAIEILICN